MADNPALDSFLTTGTTPEGAPTPPQAPEPKPAPEPHPEPQKPPEPKHEPPAKEVEDDEDDAEVSARDGETLVPRRAYETERRRRQDWKTKYAAEQARAELLAKQLEEAKKPPPAPQAPPQQQYYAPPPDPGVDPRGWAQHMTMVQQQVDLNRNLNTSEYLARDKLGDEKVDAAVSEFQVQVQKDPTLWGKLYTQAMPYQWLVKEMDRRRAQADIGDDPAAYRARIAAEERAKWEAEVAEQRQANGTARVSPAAGMPPSLANARSVAGRTTTTFTGPPAMEELFPGSYRQKPAQR